MALENTHSVDSLLFGKDYLMAKKVRADYISITRVGSFQPEKIISGETQSGIPKIQVTGAAKAIKEVQGHVGPAVPVFVVYKRASRKEPLFSDLFSDFGTSGALDSALEKLSFQALEITDDARKRLIGYEKLAERIYSLIQEQFFAFGTTGKARVRPAWSHEYDDSTGVVIDVNIAADDNLRFLLWDSISEKVAELPDVSQDEKRFLHNNISLFVTTRE
jgi:hypothetical protein